jgi:predicted membrane chloride channel (bestrophin family)
MIEQAIDDKHWTRLFKLVRTAIRLANWRRDELNRAQAEIKLLKAYLALAEAQRNKLRTKGDQREFIGEY